MAKLFNLARMSTATTSTGTITLGVAVSGYLTFAQAGVADQDIVAYSIKDGSNSENGTGLYTSSGTTLTRNVAKSTNSNAAINLSGTAEVFITPRAEDMQPAVAGHLFGLGLSTAGSSATFAVASGRAADATAVEPMVLASSLSKTTGSWAVGSGNGGLDSGAIAANTWYHAHLIKRADTGVVDALVSLSVSSPTLPTNYTWARRIGSMLTDGAKQWTAFYQSGDTFIWAIPVGDISALTPADTSSHLVAMSVPTGVVVEGIFVGYYQQTSGSNIIYFSSPNVTAISPAGTAWTFQGAAVSQNFGGEFRVFTNTTSQIRYISQSASVGVLNVNAKGWVDRRGRDS